MKILVVKEVGLKVVKTFVILLLEMVFIEGELIINKGQQLETNSLKVVSKKMQKRKK